VQTMLELGVDLENKNFGYEDCSAFHMAATLDGI
jgi:hypothetical protein